HMQATLTDMALRFGPKVLAALVILAAGVIAGRWIGRATERSLARLALEPPVRQLLVRIVSVLVVGLFAIMALQNLGIELLPLIAGLGVAGAGVALAAQGVLGNMVAGLTIIFTRPYRVGEFISIVGVEGNVEAISLFNTVLSHADRSRVVVPNRKIVGEILHNYGRIRQTQVTVAVAYGADLKLALATLTEVVRANPRVLADPVPSAQITALGASAVQLAAKPWVAVSDYGAVETELNLSLVEAMRRRGIEMPSSQLQVRLLGSPESLRA
ncbi:MAG TPA: mechanosensitive ion channel domain-containing protein, partial [Burkholderiaceae bacterium]|nr:mechanosensitive ion channel domain-containing protein [Burkholderiaceae bacterium]